MNHLWNKPSARCSFQIHSYHVPSSPYLETLDSPNYPMVSSHTMALRLQRVGVINIHVHE